MLRLDYYAFSAHKCEGSYKIMRWGSGKTDRRFVFSIIELLKI